MNQQPLTPPRHPVFLVGAGPGDPELLTLKAVRILREASVILVDDLVGEQVLASALGLDSTTADAASVRKPRIIHVGKRGHAVSTPQAFIERLMVREALAGEKVVRLKGGDPLIFGRASEEIAALHAAGLEVIVVNGISSGLAAAAAAGFSLTDRRCQAHGVLLVTGQCRAGAPGPDWATIGQLAAAGITVVIYMGISRCADITAQLRSHLPPHWPAAVVQHASGKDQRWLHCSLEQLPALAGEGVIQSPSIIVLGPVVLDAVQAVMADAMNAAGNTTLQAAPSAEVQGLASFG